MAYKKTVWKNSVFEKPRTFKKQENMDGTITLHPAFGEVIESGTKVSAETMNNIENGIEEAHKKIDSISGVEIELSAEKVTLDSSNFKSKNVKGALEEVFTYASEGKKAISKSITGKGVDASSVDSFSTLASKIDSIKVGDYSIGDLVPISKCEPHYTLEPSETLNENKVGETDAQGGIICGYNDNVIILNYTSKTLFMVDKFGKTLKEVNIETFCGVSNYKGLNVVYSETDKVIFINWVNASNTHYFIEISVDLTKVLKKITLEYKEFPEALCSCKDNQGNIYCYMYSEIFKFSPTGSFLSRIPHSGVTGMVYHEGSLYVISSSGLSKYTPDLHTSTRLTSQGGYRDLRSANALFVINVNQLQKISPINGNIEKYLGECAVYSVADKVLVKQNYSKEINIYDTTDLSTPIKTSKVENLLQQVFPSDDKNIFYGVRGNIVYRYSYYNNVLTHYKLI